MLLVVYPIMSIRSKVAIVVYLSPVGFLYYEYTYKRLTGEKLYNCSSRADVEFSEGGG